MTQDDLSDADIEAALAALEQEQQQEPEAMGEALSGASPQSPTLVALVDARRPQASTVCERCPNSIWFASPTEVKCYCRAMFLVTWSSKEPNQITHCDGVILGQE